MEVMGLMLGEFVDDYTVRVVDVSPRSFSFSLQNKNLCPGETKKESTV